MTTNPTRFVSISEARELPGLRLVVIRGVPSPWSQAARAIFRVKGLAYTLVQRAPSDPPGALEAWTGQASFPAAMYEAERPRTVWAEILHLARAVQSVKVGMEQRHPASSVLLHDRERGTVHLVA